MTASLGEVVARERREQARQRRIQRWLWLVLAVLWGFMLGFACGVWRVGCIVLAIAVTGCLGDGLSAPTDAVPMSSCCALAPADAGPCFAAEFPPGTCGVVACPTFEVNVCGPPKPDPYRPLARIPPCHANEGCR